MATQGQLSTHTLGNKYVLGDLLGYGGFGEVYQAHNLLLNRPQAIKVILEKHLSDPKFRARFLREARTLAALNHPNIVHVDDFRLEAERAYLVMPFIAEGTLHGILTRRGVLDLPEVEDYLRQICAALDHAHAQGVVHLDLKPRNLLHQHGTLLLSDFGLAHLMKRGALEGGTSLGFGSPFYIAPEQIHGRPEMRSDLYALGVILYQMLTGHLPFEGSAPEAILFKHWTEPPPPLHVARPDLPPALGRVVDKALAKNPEERYATAGKLLQAFSASLSVPPYFLTQPPSTAEHSIDDQARIAARPTQPLKSEITDAPATPVVAGNMPAKQNISRRAILAGLGTLALVGATGGSIAWFSRSRSSTSQPPLPDTRINSAGTMFGFDLQRTHFYAHEQAISPTNVARLVPAWIASTGGSLSLLGSSPVVANNVVYVGSEDHKLHAFNARTGQSLWTATTGDDIFSSPAVANNVVYVGSNDHKLYAFNATTGKTLWTATTDAVVRSSPIVANNVVYVGSDDHKLYAFNATTGKARWSAFTNGSLQYSSPAIADGIVYIGSQDNKLYAFDAATGQTRWTITTGESINSSPAVSDGVVYIGDEFGDKLYALDIATQRTRWISPVGNGNNGATSPAVANGVVYVGSDYYTLQAVDIATGTTLWVIFTGAQIFSSPAVANGVVYIGSWDYTFYALSAATGQKLWSYKTGDAISASPTIANGMIYINSSDGKLYAFHIP